MVAPIKLFIQSTVFLCTLCICTQGWSITPPSNFPEPPPLPPELRNSAPVPPPNLPDPSELQDQLKQLSDLLNMEPEKLIKLRQTIEFIEKMSAEERVSMRIRLSQITQSTPALRTEILNLSARFPELRRSDLTQFWFAASTQEREAIHQQLTNLPENEQMAFLKAKLDAFIEERDKAFEKMRASLEAKRKSIPATTKPKP